MKEGESLSILVVSDEAAADLVTDPRTLHPFAPFLGRERTVSQAAEEAGENANTTLKRVQRYLELGLLELVRELPRAGRAVKLYRSSADVFFVPYEAQSAESLETALAERDRFWEQLLRENVVRARREAVGAYGTRIYRDPHGRVQVQTAVTPTENFTTLDPAGPAALSAWRDSVYLDFEDAKQLQRELFELLLRYQRKRGAQRYIVRVGMAPVVAS